MHVLFELDGGNGSQQNRHIPMERFATMLFRLFVVAIIGMAFVGCSDQRDNSKRVVSPSIPVEAISQVEQPYLPQVGGPEGYTGSAQCQSCHKDEYASWHRSYHRTMTQFPNEESVLADFDNVVLTNETTRFTLHKKGPEHWVRMEHLHGDQEGSLDVPVSLITGSHHMQVFWVPEGHGNLQVGFPFSWLIPEQRWVPRNSTFVRPPDVVHRPEMWNIVCSRCHTTGVEPHVDIRSRRFETRVAELGISCEACHGPGLEHVSKQLAAAEDSRPHGDDSLKEIVHPKKLDPVKASQVCGFCHSMKWIDENWRENGFTYRPGDDLEKSTPIIRPSKVNEIPGLAEFLEKNPDILQDFFWPDGVIKVSGREYNGLIESPCYTGNNFSCLSCHSMHKGKPDDQLASRAMGNDACIQCHKEFDSKEGLAAHTRHEVTSSGSECYNCHMPHTTYGVLKAIRTHQITSPRVADDLKTGRPNACNLCHLDKPLDWTAGHLADWYSQDRPEIPPVFGTNSYAMQLAVAGDAGQRALLAWHLGWPDALKASKTNWVVPVLAQLLDDPYAAVRCVAERSLQKTSTPPSPNYDFTIDPRGRPSAREDVWVSWETKLDPNASRTRSHGDRAWREQIEHWLKLRDDRPVRLRE